MSDEADIPNIQGYVPIKDAAKMLGLSDKTVYQYVSEGKIKGVRASHIILIPIEEVEKFQRGTTGRPRRSIPAWHISSGDNTQFMTLVHVQIKPGSQDAFLRRLERIRKSGRHTFPGTIIRSIMGSETNPGQAVIVLIWRGTVMPQKAEREEALEAFRRELADVLDWSTAQYNHGTVLMHT
jgi:excisionase family DNA binding protein